MRFVIISIVTMLLLGSCVSTQKFNQQLTQPIPVKTLQKDVRTIKKKLFRMHPDIDWYIKPSELAASFDSLERSITKPMKPMEYYFAVAPVLGQLRQGHTVIIPMTKKLDQQEKKRLEGSLSPFEQFKLMSEAGKYYLVEDKTIDSSLQVGAQVVAINQIPLARIADTFANVIVGDGFSDQYINYALSHKMDVLFTRLYGRQDSLHLSLIYNGEATHKTIYRIYKSERDSIKNIKDSVQNEIVKLQKQLTDSINESNADSLKQLGIQVADSTQPASMVQSKKEKKKWYDLDAAADEEKVTLKFIDSATAQITIKSFAKIFPKPYYTKIFDSLKTLNIKNLIIDLRGNPGGSLNDIHVLHGYLATGTEYKTVDTNTVTLSKYKLPTWNLVNSPVWLYPLLVPITFVDGLFYVSRTKSNNDGTYSYKMKQSELRKVPENRFTGDIYMLIDGGTFSAAAITAANFKSEKRGLLIGEETGGAYNGTVAGKLPMFKRKKTKIIFRVGTMNIKASQMDGEHGRGVTPDVVITPTVADAVAGKDAALQYALDQIAKKSTQE